jgi:hypothetical protein
LSTRVSSPSAARGSGNQCSPLGHAEIKARIGELKCGHVGFDEFDRVLRSPSARLCALGRACTQICRPRRTARPGRDVNRERRSRRRTGCRAWRLPPLPACTAWPKRNFLRCKT